MIFSTLRRTLPALALGLGFSSLPLAAQTTPFQQVADELEFREIGPTIMSGRVADIDAVESDPAVFYVAAAGGGVWKTTNMGISFEPIFESESNSSIGDVTIAQGSPNVVWVGTGEPQNRQSSPWGDGVYLSRDAGESWEHVGLEDTHHISRIQVHPADANVAYVAAVGELWDSSDARGVYKTTNGGDSWEKVLFVDENTGAIDLVMDPSDPNTLFAAMYQRQRKAWGFNGGGPGSGIFRTMDGGDSWERLSNGLPEGDMGRIGLDIYRADPNYVYAIIQADASGEQGADDNGVYRSTDRGNSWERLSDSNQRPMYYSQIRVDPTDNSRIYLGGVNLERTSDGGTTFTNDASRGVHLDHHALWINPDNSDHLLLGSDGGVSISWDRSDSWYQFRNLPISQFYEVGYDMRVPYHVCGGLQDNGSWCSPSDTWASPGIRTRDWYNVGGGDGFFTEMSEGNPRFMFSESQGGSVGRVDTRTLERIGARPDAELPDEDGQRRFNWNTPIQMSAHDPNRVYIGANYLFRSNDLGITWETISGDNSYAIDRDTLTIMGVRGDEPMMSRNDGQSNYGNIVSIAESPVDPNVLYTGSDDGRLMRTRDGGGSWTDITANVPGVPRFTYVTRIVASNADAGTVYAAFDGHRDGDFAAHLYRSRDYGESWQEIENGLPQNSLNAIAQHHRNSDLLLVGNEIGIWASLDEGDSWNELESGFPTVPVDDIEIHSRDNDIILGTHGRGIWIMDDIGGLEILTPDLMAQVAAGADVFALAPIAPGYSYNASRPQQWTPGIYEAQNGDDNQATLSMYISESMAAKASVAMVHILDGRGGTVREFEIDELEAGLNIDDWDLRMALRGSDGEWMDPGPRVMPGSYSARVTLHDENGAAVSSTEEEAFQVILDERGGLTQSEIVARNDASVESYRQWGPSNRAGQALRAANEALGDARENLNEQANPPQGSIQVIDEARDRLGELSQMLNDANAGANVWSNIQRTSFPVEGAWLSQIQESWTALPPAIRAINAWIENDLPDALSLGLDEDEMPELEPIPLPARGGGE